MVNFIDVDILYKKYKQIIEITSPEILYSYHESKLLDYTHESTKLEGNTLSKLEIKTILEDKQNIAHKHLREIYEVVNHDAAIRQAERWIEEGLPLTENMIKDFHSILMNHIFVEGAYRQHNVYITGASFKPVDFHYLYDKLQLFYDDLQQREFRHPLEKAAWIHGEFVKIHPFPDGNGIVSRLIMNYELLSQGYPMINIKHRDAYRYYQSLDEYMTHQNLDPFINLVKDEMMIELNEFIQEYQFVLTQETDELER